MVQIPYNDFLRNKMDYGANSGFEPLFMSDFLFDFQKSLTEWIIKKGRGAIFADCGTGKTLMELTWAQNVLQKTNKSVLILTPLAVSFQMFEEAEKFQIAAHNPLEKPGKGIHILNYQKLHYVNQDDYAGVVCDESSILKNFSGKIKAQVTEFMRTIPYRSLWTATAAPNDWDELGTSSEALGYLGYMDMINKFFRNLQNSSSLIRGRFIAQKWMLRPWAAKGPYWQWVASWARAMRRPSDLGFDDDGFVLPELIINDHRLIEKQTAQGLLFDLPAVRGSEERELMARTAQERCEKAAELVRDKEASIIWCNRNIDEARILKKIVPNSIEIRGSDSEEKRIEAIKWFKYGEGQRILITKPRIFGFGMNFQHCNHMVYFPTHSYEQYYQAVRRLYRFGQTRPVTVDRVYTRGFDRIVANLDRKSKNIDVMFEKLVSYMNEAIEFERKAYQKMEVELPQWI